MMEHKVEGLWIISQKGLCFRTQSTIILPKCSVNEANSVFTCSCSAPSHITSTSCWEFQLIMVTYFENSLSIVTRMLSKYAELFQNTVFVKTC